jgi:aspartyl-tRNA(Asn)/glutamyl-tRNA(Gln) amidotransferase subunit A
VSNTTDLHELAAVQAAALIRRRELSPVELVQALLERADAVDGRVQAWETLDGERALAAARAAEKVPSGAELGSLHGVPFGVKDIFDTAGLRTAAGFGPFDQRIPTEDAHVVARLKQAGGILLGRMVTTQFAQGDPSRTRNPWNLERTPAGSSAGSGAGVAARLVPLALGSQTAGSVLRPAAYNGAVGLKPTYGRVSKRGVFPLAWSLDHVGVLTRSVDDCALFLRVCAGHDPHDPGSANVPVTDYSVREPDRPPRIGFLRSLLDRATPEVQAHLEDVAHRFAAAGATVVEVQLRSSFELMLAVHTTTSQTEASAAHWQLLEQFPGAHAPNIRSYVEVGRLIPGHLYLHAQRLRHQIRADIEAALGDVDVLLVPSVSNVAPTPETTGDRSFQAPFTLVGTPAISLPSGLSRERLPLAIQLVARHWDEEALLRAARWAEAHLEPLPPPPL